MFAISDYDEAVICRGNVVSSNMIGRRIRARSDVRVFGVDLPEGDGQAYDLKKFGDYGYRVPAAIRQVIDHQNRDWTGWLYVFWHFAAEGKVVDGWVLTHSDHALVTYVTNGRSVSWDLIQQVIEIVAEKP